MRWRLVAGGVAVFGLVILIIYVYASRMAARNAAALDPLAAMDTVAAPSPCRAGLLPLAATRISTGPANASLAGGDADVASNDWTRLEVGYRFERDTADYALQLRVQWSAQEANADKSVASTRIRSERVVELFRLPAECPDLRIADLGSLAPAEATLEHWVQGTQHDLVPIPDVGVLRGVQVRFDGPGTGDERRQLLLADLPAFTVTVVTRQ